MTHGSNDLASKARAFLNRWPAVPVGSQVRARPEEFDQIAVRAVNFDSVETKPLGVCCGFGEGCDSIGDILFGHCHAAHRQARRDPPALPISRSHEHR